MPSSRLKKVLGCSDDFSQDHAFAEASSEVLTPWYNLLATTDRFIPPEPKDEATRKKEMAELLALRNTWSTKALRKKWRRSSALKDRTWERCSAKAGKDWMQSHDIDVDAYVGALNRYVFIEEKFCQFFNCNYRLLFETESCSNPGSETHGWAAHCLAEWIVYGYWNDERREMLCKVVDFTKLRPWAWGEINRLGPRKVETVLGWKILRFKKSNHTIAYKIPFASLPPGALLKTFTLKAPPDLHIPLPERRDSEN